MAATSHARPGLVAARFDGSRLEWADMVRGAAIIAVVYFHATLFLGDVGIDRTLGRAKGLFELFPLPAFFLIAGIFGARSVLNDDFRTLFVRRILPVLYVYVLWSAFRFVMFAALPMLPVRDTDVPPGDPMSLVLLPVLPASIYWFLYALALFTAVAWLLRRVPRWIVVGGAAVISTVFTTGLVNTHTIAWNRIGALFLFFVIGIFFSAEIRRAAAAARPWHVGVGLAGFLVFGAALTLFRGLTRIPFAVTLGQCLAVAAAILVAVFASRLRAISFVGASGRMSLPIYLVHLFVIVPIAYALGLFAPQWPVAVNIAVTVGLTALAVLAGFGVAALARFAPWLLAPMVRVRKLTST